MIWSRLIILAEGMDNQQAPGYLRNDQFLKKFAQWKKLFGYF